MKNNVGYFFQVNLRFFSGDGRAGLGAYSGALLHSLPENPVLPTALAAFRMNTERRPTGWETVCAAHAPPDKDEALPPS